MSRAKKLYLTLLRKETVTTSITSFYFRPSDPFDFNAGQYMQLFLPHDSDDRGTTRFFSLASSPTEMELLFVIRKGRSTFKQTLWNVKPGETIEAFGPIGKFILED